MTLAIGLRKAYNQGFPDILIWARPFLLYHTCLSHKGQFSSLNAGVNNETPFNSFLSFKHISCLHLTERDTRCGLLAAVWLFIPLEISFPQSVIDLTYSSSKTLFVLYLSAACCTLNWLARSELLTTTRNYKRREIFTEREKARFGLSLFEWLHTTVTVL